MRTNYMMTVDDVMEELGVKRSKAFHSEAAMMNWQRKDMWQFVRKDSTSLLGNKILWMLSESSMKEVFKMSAQGQNTGNLVCELPLY